MNTEKPERDDLHGEKEVRPLFGGNNPLIGGEKSYGSPGLAGSELKDQEKKVTKEKSKAEEEEKKLLDKSAKAEDEGFWKGNEKPGRFVGRFSRRKTAAWIAVGVLGFGGVGIFSIAQGPLQAIHLARILSTTFSTQERTSASRTQGMYRYLRSGDVGQTRLSGLESKVNAKILRDLKNAGITVRTNAAGQPRFIDIDRRVNPELSRMTADEAKARVASDFGVDPSKVTITGNGSLVVDAQGSTIGKKNTIIYRSLGLAYESKIKVAMGARIVTKYFDVPSLFHPLRRAEARINAATSERIKNKLQERNQNRQIKEADIRREAQLEKFQAYFEPPEATQGKIAKVKDTLSTPKNLGSIAQGGAGGALIVSSAICLANDIVGDLPEINRATGAVPSAIGALGAMAHGSQIQSGMDFTLQQIGDWVSSFYDEAGQPIWRSLELNTLAGNPTSGVPAPDSVKQSFSPDRTTKKIEEALDTAQADAVCSPLGQALQAAVGVGLLVTTGGVGTALIKTATGVASGIILYQLIDYLKQYIVDEPIYENIYSGGPLGGSLMALGAEEASGIVARSTGGVALSEKESADERAQTINESMQEFANRNVAERIFDVKDHRSLAASFIQLPTMSYAQNLGSAFINLLNPSNWLGGFAKIFTPAAGAQPVERTYDWPAPKYGFSQRIINNPIYDDPYENAEIAEGLLDENAEEYNDRAGKCFGVKFEDSGGWSVIAEKDVNPASNDYQEADCAEESQDWTRIRLYIFDVKNMEAFACLNGDPADADIQEACINTGIGSQAVVQTQTASVEPPDTINGYRLTDNEKKHLKYIADNVLSKLDGDNNAKAKFAAESAWWSLRESVLNLDNPFGYSNCADTGNDHIGYVDPCNKRFWQVGIGAPQVPDQPDAQVPVQARKYNPGKSLQEIIDEVSKLAGFTEGSPEFNQARNSTGSLRKSLLLRDPATGIVMVNDNVQPCYGGSMPSWCQGSGRPGISGSAEEINKATSEIEAYFLSVLNGPASGATTAPGGIPSPDSLGRNSDGLQCAPGSNDLGVVTTLYTGSIKKESGPLKIRLCQIPDIPGEGNNTSGVEISGGATVDARVSGAWVALAKAAKADGVTLKSSSSFRLAHSCGGTGDGTNCARPGQSLHQTGLAIDFAEMGGFTATGSSTSCSGRMTHSGPAWRWMKDNAARFGAKQYSRESWHWDFLGGSNRC